MEKFVIDNQPYVSIAEACTALGIEKRNVPKVRVFNPEIKNHIISNYHPQGSKLRRGINIIDREGLIILARESTVRNKERVFAFLNDSNIIFNMTPPTQTTPTSPTNVTPPNIPTYTNDFVNEGIKLMVDMFDGVNKVTFYDDDKGMRWTMGADIYHALKLDKYSAKHVFERIKYRHPEYLQVYNLNNLMVAATATIRSDPHKYLPELKTRGNKDRIFLNKYGVAMFFQELDVARIEDPETQERCYKFKDWMVHLVGDVLSGEIEVNHKTTNKTSHTTTKIMSAPKTIRLIRETFTLAECMSKFNFIPEDICAETALTIIESEAPHIKRLDVFRALLRAYCPNLNLPSSTTRDHPKVIEEPPLAPKINELERKIETINTQTRKYNRMGQAFAMVIESMGMNANDVFEKIETVDANLT